MGAQREDQRRNASVKSKARPSRQRSAWFRGADHAVNKENERPSTSLPAGSLVPARTVGGARVLAYGLRVSEVLFESHHHETRF
jgi:hypothetical protein